MLVKSRAIFEILQKCATKHVSHFLRSVILPLFSFADSVKTIAIDSRKLDVSRMSKRNDERWMHESKNDGRSHF